MAVRVERYTQDRFPALRRFLLESYPASPLKADEGYFQWRFAQDPRGSSLDHYFLAVDGERVVGQWCGIDDRVWIEGGWREAIWLVDLMVDPAYRRSAALLGLAKAVMSTGRLCLAVGADEHVVPLYDALRWRRLRPMETFFAPLRPSRLASLAASTGRASSRLAWIWPMLRAADLVGPAVWRTRLALRGPSRGLRIEDAPTFGSSVDELIARTTPYLERTTERSAAILNWKFNRRPVGSHFTLAARDAGDARLRGYMTTKLMERDAVRWAEVSDFLVEPDDAAALDALIQATVGQALRRGVDFLRLRCGVPWQQRLLKRPWWIAKTTPVVDEVFAYSADRRLLDALAAGPWRLTSLASDRVDYGRDDWSGDSA